MIHDCRDCKHIGCGHASDEPCDGWEHMGGIKMSWAKAQPSKATFTIELVELLVVRHGSHHNDTLITVERKV